MSAEREMADKLRELWDEHLPGCKQGYDCYCGKVWAVARDAASLLETVAAERDALREALTPSGETKAAYIGEFTIAVERHVNEDEEVDDEAEGAPDPYEHIMVPWTTIKEIMASIRSRSGSKP